MAIYHSINPSDRDVWHDDEDCPTESRSRRATRESAKDLT